MEPERRIKKVDATEMGLMNGARQTAKLRIRDTAGGSAKQQVVHLDGAKQPPNWRSGQRWVRLFRGMQWRSGDNAVTLF
jgi:hypothetical protein